MTNSLLPSIAGSEWTLPFLIAAICIFLLVRHALKEKRLRQESFENPLSLTLDDAGILFKVLEVREDKILLRVGLVWIEDSKTRWLLKSTVHSALCEEGRIFLVVNDNGSVAMQQCMKLNWTTVMTDSDYLKAS